MKKTITVIMVAGGVLAGCATPAAGLMNLPKQYSHLEV